MRGWASRYARLVLERCGNNKRKACRQLDISYHTLQSYLRSDCRAPMRRRSGATEGRGYPPVPAPRPVDER
jgi:hypothetical protein